MPYIYNITCACEKWSNWTSYVINITNSTSPTGAIATGLQNALPWFWPVIPFILYMAMLSWYSDSPQRGKLVAIAAVILVISGYMVYGGLLKDGIFNFFIFAVALVMSALIKGL
jgi:hypothetical protein